MTKYLLNLVCIIGIVGAAHAAVPAPDVDVVANLEITLDGHAYLVFTGNGTQQLAGYQIEDINATPTLVFNRPTALEEGTGEFAANWASITDHGQLAGEFVGPDWFVTLNDGTPPAPESWIAEGSHDSYITRVAGAPIYIGKILDGLVLTDFDPGGKIETDLSFMTLDTAVGGPPTAPDSIKYGSVSLRTPAAMPVGETPLAGGTYKETGDIGVAGTDFDATYVGASTVVVDLKVDPAAVVTVNGDVTTTEFTGADGHVMVNGAVVPIVFADHAADTVALTGRLRLGAVIEGAVVAELDGTPYTPTTTIAIDADTTQSGTDLQGRFGTLGSTMVITAVAGDFNYDGVCDDLDIDMISGVIHPSTGDPLAERSLLFDVTKNGVVDADDRYKVILELVEKSIDLEHGSFLSDVTLDGFGNIGDYIEMKNHWGSTGDKTWGTVAEGGDLSGDGNINIADYVLLKNNWGTPAVPVFAPPAPGAPAVTPEPATMVLLAIGGLALVRRRRRA